MVTCGGDLGSNGARDEDRVCRLAADVVGGRIVYPNHESSVTDPVHPPRARKVLIVDDQEGSDGRWPVSSARGVTRSPSRRMAREALSLAATFQPEFAILDLSLPGMNGVVLACRLRKVFPAGRLYIIALSGHASVELREACLAAGFDECLNKTEGIETLERLLGDDRWNFDESVWLSVT